MPESRPGGTDAARAEQGGHPSAAKNEPDPLIGKLISGRFKIVSVIARGGMGKVYKAEQAPLGRICALKVLSPKYEGDRDPEFHKRFFLEASTAAKLSHPNTVTVFDYGQSEADDIYYIAMEFIEGRTLHRVLRDEGAIDEARVIHIASQVCRSLREAHGLGVVHRDLKPGNILLADRGDERDYVKVLDFGLVKDVTGAAEDLTQAGLFMGSPKYMAPEQILGSEITPGTDIYSLGVMMYEMMTGKVPFDRGASVGTLMAHVNDAPPPIRDVNPAARISAGMEAVIACCLEKEPSRRFTSMKDLLAALKRVEGGEFAMTETSESMPIARVDFGPSSRGDTMTSGAHTTGGSQPPDGRSQSTTDSTLGHVAASAADATRATAGRSKSRAVIGIAAFAVAAAIGVAVMVNAKPRVDDAHVGSDGTVAQPSAASTGVPPGPSTAAVAPLVASSPMASAAALPLVRSIRVDSEPAGAAVSEGGVQLCTTTPCQVTWQGDASKADHKIILAKKGYKQAEVVVSATATDDKVASKLELVPVVVPVRAAVPAPTSTGYKPSPYGD